jgi:hypothetical protein
MVSSSIRRVCVSLALPLTLCFVVSVRSAFSAQGRFNPNAPAFSTLYEAFNDNYKQALFATSEGGKERAARELAGTRIAWEMLLARYYDAPPEQFAKDHRWQADLATMTGYIEIADLQLGAGKLQQAHDALEPVRHLWLEIRQRNGIPWFGDELTRFHDVMEPVVQLAVAGVRESSVGAFEAKLGDLSKAWRRVEEFGFAPRSMERQKQCEEMMAAETQAIANLEKATGARDYGNIGPLALAVKRAFAALYLAFG